MTILNNKFFKIFDKIPVLGMIHLAGDNPVKRALEELSVFEEEGINGAIIENYHGNINDVIETLQEIPKLNTKVVIGVNVLPNEYDQSFSLANKYGADFIQLDYVAGKYLSGELDLDYYVSYKERFPQIVVLGGVWPKYYHPVHGSNLEDDIRQGMQRSEAIVVTGAGTGEETPINKVKTFRRILGKHPLIIGAGLNPGNAYEQLYFADGAIVGSSLKTDYKTYNQLDKMQIRDLISIVQQVRSERNDKE